MPLTRADEWFEEDQPLIFMIRDPYRRVDILESTREVTIHVDNVEVARSTDTRLWLENGMPALWYVPLPHGRERTAKSIAQPAPNPCNGAAVTSNQDDDIAA